MEPEGAFHLSAQMCGQHRSDVIEQIKARLQAGQTCRVVSTQLIECGVDLDFPLAFRALAGLDSIAQAAGRCNREGRLESRPGAGLCAARNPAFGAYLPGRERGPGGPGGPAP